MGTSWLLPPRFHAEARRVAPQRPLSPRSAEARSAARRSLGADFPGHGRRGDRGAVPREVPRGPESSPPRLRALRASAWKTRCATMPTRLLGAVPGAGIKNEVPERTRRIEPMPGRGVQIPRLAALARDDRVGCGRLPGARLHECVEARAGLGRQRRLSGIRTAAGTRSRRWPPTPHRRAGSSSASARGPRATRAPAGSGRRARRTTSG